MKNTFIAAAMLTLAMGAQAADHPVVKRGFNLPPSAELVYSVKGSNHGIPLSGTGTVNWRQGEGKYTLTTEARSALFGKVLDYRSEGAVDDYGLAPATYYEKRIRKDPTTTTFNRESKQIEFQGGEPAFPLKGGEQDRSSAQWQLVSQARHAPDQFKPGTEWAFFTAGRKDAEVWSFKVVGPETLQTGAGELKVVHFVKAPPKRDAGQQVDLWLAPGLEWYPVKIRFMEENGDSFEQLLEKVNRK
ncbi:DUF3108 domain-containing protein [Pseudoduganella sp. RAF53_2]|uniref:DUF3108 domain-containing protein n=1 Tax=unclassified Pseudoduganella TaxID=2637179 RepID=UPI003F9650D2